VLGPPTGALRLGIESVNLDLEAKKRRETQIYGKIEELQARVDETPRREQELLGLTRDYNNLTETYRTLLGKKYEAAIARNLEQAQKGERFRLLRPAQVPQHPTWPDPKILIPAGLGIGLALVGLLIVISEIRYPAFRSVERLKRMIGLPVFASIPEIDNDAIYEVEPNGEVDPKLVVFTAPESAPAEQYRGFIPTLLDAEGCQVILVTSAARGDGKTLTCMNLAVSLATDLDKRVLVIDTDLRRPSVHRVVRVSRKQGLSNILNGEAKLEECVINSKISNLTVLPAGPTVRNPLALMTGDRFLELLAEVRKRYDLILIDSPPLLPVVDAQILRKMADMLLFVVRADSTPREAVVRSLRDMRDVAGLVFNGVSPGAFRRHYYYDAYSRYAYGDETAGDEESIDG
jgi:capsular exopolysaccharide synthesis family protein